jgi:lipoyl(octanoyl) transferase
VTYHGPGQLVGYPVLSLRDGRRDVARYLRDLEEVLIRTLGVLGVAAGRVPGATGVWADGGKIASIGVHLSRWVTTHGFALNVSTDLAPFELIVPCGMRAAGVTSMARLLGQAPPLRAVADTLVGEFAAVFEREMAASDEAPASAGAPASGGVPASGRVGPVPGRAGASSRAAS